MVERSEMLPQKTLHNILQKLMRVGQYDDVTKSERLVPELAHRIRESLVACGLEGGSLQALPGSPEMLSRIVIDAVLVPLCCEGGIQLRLEETLGSSPFKVSSRADYTLRRKHGRRRGDRGELLGVVEAKRCDQKKWAAILAQAACQAT